VFADGDAARTNFVGKLDIFQEAACNSLQCIFRPRLKRKWKFLNTSTMPITRVDSGSPYQPFVSGVRAIKTDHMSLINIVLWGADYDSCDVDNVFGSVGDSPCITDILRVMFFHCTRLGLRTTIYVDEFLNIRHCLKFSNLFYTWSLRQSSTTGIM
jgi:hypothetical protein